MKKVIFIIALENFRDEELLQPKEVLEEAGVGVKIASTSLNEAKGVLGATVMPDMLLSDVKPEEFDAVIFVGGAGAAKYWDDPIAHKLVKDIIKEGKILGAICIAPVILAKAGVLKGKKATVWQTESGQLNSAGANYTGKPVEKDGNIVTASGPTVAKQFGQEILNSLK